MLGFASPAKGWLRAFFEGVPLLHFEHFDLEDNALLDTARFSAILFVTWVGFVVAMAFIRKQAIRRRVIRGGLLSWRKRGGHVIVCGAGWKGRSIVEELVLGPVTKSARTKTKTRRRVAVIEKATDDAFDLWCRSRHVALIHGDATDPETLLQAGIDCAAKLFVLCHDDDTNMQVASAASRVCGDGAPLKCVVEMRSPSGAEALVSAMGLAPGLSANGRVSRIRPIIFDTEAATVRVLLETYPFDCFEQDPKTWVAHTIILGDNAMSRELLRQVLQMGYFEQPDVSDPQSLCPRTLKVSLLVDDPGGFCQRYTDRFPAFLTSVEGIDHLLSPRDRWIVEANILPRIRVRRLPKSERDLFDPVHGLTELIEPKVEIVSIYVVLEDGIRALALAQQLATSLGAWAGEQDIHIRLLVYVSARDPDFQERMGSLSTTLAQSSHLSATIFGDFVETCSVENVEHNEIESRAKRLHLSYVRSSKGQGPLAASATTADDLAHMESEWELISEEAKDSNRQAAAHIPVKVRILDRCRDRPRVDSMERERQRTLLAKAEHNQLDFLMRDSPTSRPGPPHQ